MNTINEPCHSLDVSTDAPHEVSTPSGAAMQAVDDAPAVDRGATVRHRSLEIQGVDVAYREAGSPANPTVLLLHGFPTSSHMFRELIPRLADDYHVLAPDYPGFGASGMPTRDEFAYTFANLAAVVDDFLKAKGVDRFAVYVMDYGAPIGFRVFAMDPGRVTGFIIQNGNAYEEGLEEFWDTLRAFWDDPSDERREGLRELLTLDATRWQYTHGVGDAETISPDNWHTDQYLLDRPGNQEIQLDLFHDYRTNVASYPQWQELFRQHQPPALITWGRNDYIFPESGAHAYMRDLEDVELHLLDTGHFALEEYGRFIAAEIRDFLARTVR